MDSRDLKLTKEVWRKLHHTPELSGQETKTKEILKGYLTNYTTLSVVETPDYLYTVYEEKDCEQPQLTICLRADMDAIRMERAAYSMAAGMMDTVQHCF